MLFQCPMSNKKTCKFCQSFEMVLYMWIMWTIEFVACLPLISALVLIINWYNFTMTSKLFYTKWKSIWGKRLKKFRVSGILQTNDFCTDILTNLCWLRETTFSDTSLESTIKWCSRQTNIGIKPSQHPQLTEVIRLPWHINYSLSMEFIYWRFTSLKCIRK